MMAENCVTVFVRIFIVTLAFFGVFLMYVYNVRVQEIGEKTIKEGSVKQTPSVVHVNDAILVDMKYILQWTQKSHAPFDFMGSGNSAFIKNKCKFTNCFVTDDTAFINLTDFDAVVFNGKDILRLQTHQFPSIRSPKQKYIFGAMESPGNYPVCNEMFDNYFNWTWTYKLDSDFRWGYITVYDTQGNVVGPAIDMKWPENMDPISEDLKIRLSTKSKAAAWFVSHCNTKSKRESFVAEVNRQLYQFGWKVDIYGPCGNFSCPRSHSRSCFKIVESDYYFYFSLENSFSEDYVTEKLLTALNNYAVPVVFGAANYSRFLPAGSYIDGRKLGPKNVARTIDEVIRNKTMYYDFFRWRNHFTYNETSDNADICRLCEVLNDSQMVNNVSAWKDFRVWWNGAAYRDNCS